MKDIAGEKEQQGPEVEDSQSCKNAYWTGGHPSYPGTGQADQCGSPSSEAQDTGRPCYEDSRGSTRGENTSPFPKMNKYICVSAELRTIIYFEKIY